MAGRLGIATATTYAYVAMAAGTLCIGSALADPTTAVTGMGWPDVAQTWVDGWRSAHPVVQGIWGIVSLMVLGEITGISVRIRDRLAGRVAGSAAQISALGVKIDVRFDRLDSRFNGIEDRVARIEGTCRAIHGPGGTDDDRR